MAAWIADVLRLLYDNNTTAVLPLTTKVDATKISHSIDGCVTFQSPRWNLLITFIKIPAVTLSVIISPLPSKQLQRRLSLLKVSLRPGYRTETILYIIIMLTLLYQWIYVPNESGHDDSVFLIELVLHNNIVTSKNTTYSTASSQTIRKSSSYAKVSGHHHFGAYLT